ncbi:peptide chain release factor N(5)-glutamine methyltransferase [Shewanella sp. NIFS-20-20]|uniref:peptide chain release factor N(5)-glutamine methyltransferase n=1 Tax=Shewanella sp. NIFS-20-20 TaxID=2853806 RepID=UPI001C43ABD8|nr:peptide chain release factor N(5)-glutamine methyltransferase [Shewanella sp. NIFS-20-20]MBV7315900.1 peptide chain release factor N(5)-glutamine methyltransferase [Shewanella sp. NIFS-20-20]
MTLAETIEQALRRACLLLNGSSDTAALDSEILLQHVLDKNRTYLFTWGDKRLTATEAERFQQLLALRLEGHPIAHLIGEREFFSLPFKVNPTTLIPRPDTEVLVETALALPLPSGARVLDLGTGTGAIALSLAHERPQWQIKGVDKVAAAVALACENRQMLGLERVEICQSDWFSAVSEQAFDLIVSNPPYIDENDHHLSQGDVRFEPLSALTAADAGYQDLFYIAEHSRDRLVSGGYLLMEHGFEQGARLRNALSDMGYVDVKTIKDYGDNERCTLARWP